MKYVKEEDLSYFMQQSDADLDMIIAGMSSIFSDTDDKVQAMANQGWFKRIWKTVSGSNRATKEAIQQNNEKLSMYAAEALSELYKRNCIDERMLMSLGQRLNDVYLSQTKLKGMLGQFVVSLNNKIESVNNFHLLITEIDEGLYSRESALISIIEILSQLDNRVIQHTREMNALTTAMEHCSILTDKECSIFQLLDDITNLPAETIGRYYIELSNLSLNSMLAKTFTNAIEQYTMLSRLDKKLKKKDAVFKDIISDNQIDENIKVSSAEIWEDLLASKSCLLDNQDELLVDNELDIAPSKNEDITEELAENNQTDSFVKQEEDYLANCKSTDTVDAPMPGKILSVDVKVGEVVQAGDILMILEAMKMQNEIMVPWDGIVGKIYVQNGSIVNTGDPLVKLGR